MSYAVPRHRKPPRSAASHGRAPSRHRKPQARRTLLRGPALALVIAAAVTVSGAAVAGAVTFLPAKPRAEAPDRALTSGGALAAGGHSSALAAGLTLAELSKSAYAVRAAASSHARTPAAGARVTGATKRKHHDRSRLAAPVYLNPLRAIAGLIPQRIDMGADFAGPVPSTRSATP